MPHALNSAMCSLLWRFAAFFPGADSFGPLQVVEIDEAIHTEDDWLWRVTWHEGVGYGVVYQAITGASGAQLVSTRDGLRYKYISTLPITGEPNEVTLRFDRSGQMVALVRREGEDASAHFGSASAPFTEWSFRELPERMGGPNLVQLPGGEWLAAYRRYRPNGQQTALALIELNCSLQQLAAIGTHPLGFHRRCDYRTVGTASRRSNR